VTRFPTLQVDAASAVVALRAQLCPALLCKTLDGVHAVRAPLNHSCCTTVRPLAESALRGRDPLRPSPRPPPRAPRPGCTLLDRALAELDPPLAAHLAGAGLSAKIFAFPWVLTLGACFPPAAEAARALDFLLGEGLHHIVLLAAARVLALRSELLATARPMQVRPRARLGAHRCIVRRTRRPQPRPCGMLTRPAPAQVLQRLPLLDGAGAVAGARALWPRLSAALRAEIAAFPGAGVRPGAAGTAAALEDGDGGGSE
jgi:hypothetical protein